MTRRHRRLWHPKRSDVTFVLGCSIIVAQIIRGRWDAAAVMAAMVLLGVPLATRADDIVTNGKPKPPPVENDGDADAKP